MKFTNPETIPAGENCVQMLSMTLQVLQQSIKETKKEIVDMTKKNADADECF